MGLIRQLRRLFGNVDSTGQSYGVSTVPSPSLPHMVEEEPEPDVKEVDYAELRAALTSAHPPVVLDVREPYEWRQVRIGGALHIPMGDLPSRVAELDPSRPVVVMCAHGIRSYSVAAWLGEEGIDAASLRGGIAEWARAGGPVEQGSA